MPKTHRDLIHRKLAQAYININWAATYLLELHNEFMPIHPELGEMLKVVLEGLDIQTDILTMFGKEISGMENIDWQAWAATGRPTHGIDNTLEYQQQESMPIADESEESPNPNIEPD